MIPHSPAMDGAVSFSHTIVSTCSVCDIYGNPTGDPLFSDMPIVEGEISIDGLAAARRTFTCTVIDETGNMTPKMASDTLQPYGTLITIFRGLEYPGGSQELLQQGLFWLTTVDVLESGGQTQIQLKGQDMSLRVSRSKFQSTYQILTGPADYGNTVLDIIYYGAEAGPWLQWNVDLFNSFPTVTVGPATFDIGSDPWTAAQSIAALINSDLYFDNQGVLQMTPTPWSVDDSNTLWSFKEGELCIFDELDRTIDATKAPNHWIVLAESSADSTAPVRGEAWDNDPTSPTYRYGPYGDFVQVYTSPTATNATDCQNAATYFLSRNLTAVELVTLQSICHPALDSGDAVYALRERAGVNFNGRIVTATIPLIGSNLAQYGIQNRFVDTEVS